MTQTKHQILQTYFGYSEFREGQEEIIDALLQRQDVLGIMPTGAGKSLCYQIPALVFDGITLVISPLISLMKDQVSALKQVGVPAAYLNSSLTPTQQNKMLMNTRQGRYKLIYIAPEQLTTNRFLELSRHLKIDFISVDEAHCVSQWGQDFRPGYLQINDYINQLPIRPVVGAFTATATPLVKEDITQLLKLKDPYTITTGFDRKNLTFTVAKPKDKFDFVAKYVDNHEELNGVIYCNSRKNVEEVTERLNEMGYSATRYHAGLEDAERKLNQELFVTDQAKIMIATNAFGMGIDKSNVSFVIHYNMPKNMESYYQEAGRAGRDGSTAECVLLYSGRDVVTNQYFIDNNAENDQLSEEERDQFKKHEQERLKRMSFYCFTQDCLRHYILMYFGERSPHYCGNCSTCLANTEKIDVTISAQKIISCVKRLRENYGIRLVIDVLRGSEQQRIKSLHLDKLSTYGLMKETSEKQLRQMIEFMLAECYLEQVDGQYPTLKLGFRAIELLKPNATLMMNLVKEEAPKKKKRLANDDIKNPALFAKLQVLRRNFADQQKVPAYIVFTDATLREMTTNLPTTASELTKINGVGEAKLAKYGEDFLELITDYIAEQA
ncbi:DNA helicase RecQ [Vagococcus intermedius]|uniref:DNA helicase RecQ n=1 Tax=Vagococcus intermedius TaxID=2991418 RepID=A0AAF0I6U2_9ENTE|nr:DNA helicase RecQ [Vagococcus intermedius]WEG73813.1 DNA helicase RecQ [Vagococcus intermedius]WEG75898.1 DNA helicase RecQ [Vagococcus intermedius]